MDLDISISSKLKSNFLLKNIFMSMTDTCDYVVKLVKMQCTNFTSKICATNIIIYYNITCYDIT